MALHNEAETFKVPAKSKSANVTQHSYFLPVQFIGRCYPMNQWLPRGLMHITNEGNMHLTCTRSQYSIVMVEHTHRQADSPLVNKTINNSNTPHSVSSFEERSIAAFQTRQFHVPATIITISTKFLHRIFSLTSTIASQIPDNG